MDQNRAETTASSPAPKADISALIFPSYSPREFWADAVIHGLGIAFALIAGPILIGYVAADGEWGATAAVSVYVATLIAMLAASAGYNMWPVSFAKEWLRRLDHSTIYLKIAGAYTPFAALTLTGGSGKRLLIGMWLAAVSGVVMKLIWPHRFHLISVGLYLLMGWAVIPMAADIHANVNVASWVLMLVAGCVYSGGIVFHLWTSLPYHNAIWHFFVLAGTALIYAAIAIEFA